MAVELAVTAGPNAGHAFRFVEHASFIVGRSPQAHFVLPDSDPYVSRYQFLVEVNPPFVRVRDMGSRSGTWINGTKTEQADLKDGDSIKIGVTTLRVRIESPAPIGDSNRLRAGIATSTEAAIPSRGRSGSPDAERPAQGVAHTLDLPGEAHETVSKTVATTPGEVPSLGLANLLRPTPTPAGYELGRELGRGGMGVVYEARHLATGRKVALKSILPQIAASETTVKKFLREAAIVRQLDHPHVVMYVDSGEVEGTIWYAMEYVSGEDAARVIVDPGNETAS